MASGKRHYRITEADAAFAHDVVIAIKGRPGINDYNLVLSAIGRPYIGYYRSIVSKAAALIQSMACNHGYVDGNKRTAIILTLLLIDQSGYALRPAKKSEDLNVAIEQFVISVVDDKLTMDEIKEWYKARIIRKAPAKRN